MNISYTICVKDELEEIKQLIPLITKYLKKYDQLIVQVDDRCPEEVWEYLCECEQISAMFKNKFENDFSQWKNNLFYNTSGDFLFNIDADELPSEILLENIHEILESNPECEAYWLCRENYVEGLTPQHIQQWGWRIDEKNRINFPDSQLRIFKNEPKRIFWQNKVHEQLVGYKMVAVLPEEYCLIHKKTIERQEKQNNFYNTL